MILKNGKAFIDNKFSSSDIYVNNDIIDTISANIDSDDNIIDCTDKYLIPGLVDIHTHGCAGFDFSSADEHGIEKMQKYYLSNGITSILPTTVALSNDDIITATDSIKSAAEKYVCGARIQGINLEGPYLSPNKCGAHDISLLKEPDIDFVNSLGDSIKVVHIAPEYSKAFDFIKKFKGKVSIAHTGCDYKTAMDAIALGADHITHIFNAMNGLHHREPGVIGAFFDSEATAEMICDSIHINSAILRMMFKAYGERIAIISDSMAATGLDDGVYKLGSLDVSVKSGVAKLSDGTLAGSAMNIFDMVKNLIDIGVPCEKAFASATSIPAKSVGLESCCGFLKTGRKADIIILNKDFSVHKVVFDGKIIS